MSHIISNFNIAIILSKVVPILIMIMLISVLIIVHEAGHFIAARLCGVRVTRFGFGMPIGPSWKLFKWNKTTFYLHAFLFGGYVSFPDDEKPESSESSQTWLDERRRGQKDVQHMHSADEAVGLCETGLPESSESSQTWLDERRRGQKDVQHMHSADEAAPSAEPFQGDVGACALRSEPEQDKQNDENDEDEILPPDSPELYENKTIGQKLFIVSAGVIMNIIFAIILVIFCAAFYHKLPSSHQGIYIDSLSDEVTSNINQYDIQKNDKIIEINGIKINTMYQLSFLTKNSKLFDDYAQKDLIEYNLNEIKKLNPDIKDIVEQNTLILLPETKAENALAVNKNITIGLEKYKKDGIKLSKEQIDLRNEIYNKRVYKVPSQINVEDLAYALSDTYKPLTIKLLRGDREIILENIKVKEQGLLGIKLDITDSYVETKTFKDIIFKSCDYLYSTTSMMLFSLWQLVSGKINASDMHGVIAIVKVGGDIIAYKGLLNGILLTAMISINLAIMNFLPIPALDGGHVLFLVIEKLTGKKPTKELGEKINNVFFVLLIILMIAICYNDIFALVTKKL